MKSTTRDGHETLGAGTLYAELAEHAERARWKLADVPWDALRPEAASSDLRALVRELVFSEHATYSATQQFLRTFSDDIELSQWMSVWFYEETRHPHVLTEWLRRLGEHIEPAFVRQGRVSTPFMRSRMGVLVTNVVSELMASEAYRCLSAVSPEPVLGALAASIARDEARHAVSFFRFARARLERSRDRDRERLDALKVLHFWLNAGDRVTHPVGQIAQRLICGVEGAAVIESFDVRTMQRRACRMIGRLVEAPVRESSDVLPLVRELVRAR